VLALNALLALDRLPGDATGREALAALLRRHGLRPSRIVAAQSASPLAYRPKLRPHRLDLAGERH
jgi:hypothetical protein